MKMSTIKTKATEFRKEEPEKTKIKFYDHIIRQVSHFKYMRNYIVYDKNNDTGTKLGKLQMTCVTTNCMFRNKLRQETKL